MTRSIMTTLVFAAITACGGGGRPVDIPVVPAGEYEADCQAMCTLAAGEQICTATHAEFCVAKCRARTNGLATTCAACLLAAGTPINGFTNQFGDSYCTVGGPADMTACVAECDDAGAVPSPPSIDVLCDLECDFYIQGEDPIACSAAGADPCRADCAATIAAEGRICAQCLIDQTIPTSSCFGNDCDCEPIFDNDPTFGCMDLCDAI